MTTRVLLQGSPVSVGGTPYYRLDVSCLNPGDLPDAGLFVLEIMDPGDPTADVLARITAVVDFNDYTTSREAAVGAGDSMWRSSTMSMLYEDLETADNAKTAVYDSLNALADAYDEMVSRFTTSVTAEFPIATDSQLRELVTTYATKVAAREDMEAAVSTAQVALLTGQDTVDTTERQQTEYDGLVAELILRLQEMVNVNSAVGMVRTLANNFANGFAVLSVPHQAPW